ncbi:hypothetical protein ACFPRL_32450 [Pseudoclavibacter helvolus]
MGGPPCDARDPGAGGRAVLIRGAAPLSEGRCLRCSRPGLRTKISLK